MTGNPIWQSQLRTQVLSKLRDRLPGSTLRLFLIKYCTAGPFDIVLFNLMFLALKKSLTHGPEAAYRDFAQKVHVSPTIGIF